MSAQGKWYVVWDGVNPGIYPSWEECRLQVEGYPNARYKGFASKEEAIMAYRGNPLDYIGVLRSIVEHSAQAPKTGEPVDYSRFPEIRLDAIAVDGACSKNPGPTEYRCVHVGTGQQLFHNGPLQGGSNNIGEYLALVHALAMLERRGDTTTPVYSDSRTALAWLRHRSHNSKIVPTPDNREVMELLQRADRWLQAHPDIPNPVLKWDTERWGEIPADFGRK